MPLIVDRLNQFGFPEAQALSFGSYTCHHYDADQNGFISAGSQNLVIQFCSYRGLII
jgi:hypothetical protein